MEIIPDRCFLPNEIGIKPPKDQGRFIVGLGEASSPPPLAAENSILALFFSHEKPTGEIERSMKSSRLKLSLKILRAQRLGK